MCEQVCRPNGEVIYLENPHFIKRDAKTKSIQGGNGLGGMFFTLSHSYTLSQNNS